VAASPKTGVDSLTGEGLKEAMAGTSVVIDLANVSRYLKAVGDPRKVVSDPEARYWGGRVEERSLVPLGEARLGRIGLDEWLRRSQVRA
jgi:hypothetical protein